MLRPWYRSRLFWLGLPGFLFLIWAWLLVGEVYASWAEPKPGYDWFVAVGAGGGMVRVVSDHFTPMSESIMWGVPGYDYGFNCYFAGAASDPMPWSWPPIQVESREDGVRTHFQLDVALWMLVALYGSAWAAIYHKWQRRKSRLLKLHAASPP